MTAGRRWRSARGAALLALAAAGCHFILDPDSIPPPAPSELTYATNPATYVIGETIPGNTPSTGGVPIDAYTYQGALPTGLTLDGDSGVLNGTPLAVSRPTAYQVTAANETGSATAALTIGVNVVSAGTPLAATGLSAGGDHTCALVNGKTLCWGENGYGQIGNGTTAKAALPGLVTGLTGARAVSAGAYHTCATAGEGAQCWGYNWNGQLGTGSDASTPTVQPVLPAPARWRWPPASSTPA